MWSDHSYWTPKPHIWIITEPPGQLFKTLVLGHALLSHICFSPLHGGSGSLLPSQTWGQQYKGWSHHKYQDRWRGLGHWSLLLCRSFCISFSDVSPPPLRRTAALSSTGCCGAAIAYHLVNHPLNYPKTKYKTANGLHTRKEKMWEVAKSISDQNWEWFNQNPQSVQWAILLGGHNLTFLHEAPEQL